MKVVHILASGSRSWGGPPAMLADLASQLTKFGVETTVVTLDEKRVPNVEFAPEVRVRSCGTAAIAKLGIPNNTKIFTTLLEEIDTADIVHLHELWHMPQAIGAILSRI